MILAAGETCKDVEGTKGYLAYEVIKQKPYSFPADVFSFGVVIYKLISGYYPFPYPLDDLCENSLKEYKRLFIETKLIFPEREWRLISDTLRDLLE